MVSGGKGPLKGAVFCMRVCVRGNHGRGFSLKYTSKYTSPEVKSVPLLIPRFVEVSPGGTGFPDFCCLSTSWGIALTVTR